MKKLVGLLSIIGLVICMTVNCFAQDRNMNYRKAKILVKDASLDQLYVYFKMKSDSSDYTSKGFIKEEDLSEIPAIKNGKFIVSFESNPLDLENAIKKRTNKDWKDYTINKPNKDGIYELSSQYHNSAERDKKCLKPDDYIEINVPNLCAVSEIGAFDTSSRDGYEYIVYNVSKDVAKQIIETNNFTKIKYEENIEENGDFLDGIQTTLYNCFSLGGIKDNEIAISKADRVPTIASKEEILLYTENSDFSETDDIDSYLHTGDIKTYKEILELQPKHNYKYKFYKDKDKKDSASFNEKYNNYLDIIGNAKLEVIGMDDFSTIYLMVPNNWEEIMKKCYKKINNIANKTDVDKSIKDNGLNIPKEGSTYYYEDLCKFPSTTFLLGTSTQIKPKNANIFFKLYKDIVFKVERVEFTDMTGKYTIIFNYDKKYTELNKKEDSCYKEIKIKDAKIDELTNYYENNPDNKGFFNNVLSEIKSLKDQKILYGKEKLTAQEIDNKVKELRNKNGDGSVCHVFGIIKNDKDELQLIDRNSTLFPLMDGNEKIKIFKDAKFSRK